MAPARAAIILSSTASCQGSNITGVMVTGCRVLYPLKQMNCCYRTLLVSARLDNDNPAIMMTNFECKVQPVTYRAHQFLYDTGQCECVHQEFRT